MFCIERLADQTVEQKIIFHFGYRYMDGIHFFDNRYINQPWDSNQQLGNNKNRMNEFFHFHSIQVSHKIHLSESYSHSHTHTIQRFVYSCCIHNKRIQTHTHTHIQYFKFSNRRKAPCRWPQFLLFILFFPGLPPFLNIHTHTPNKLHSPKKKINNNNHKKWQEKMKKKIFNSQKKIHGSTKNSFSFFFILIYQQVSSS